MSMDALRETFFAECEELLDSLIANLDQISAGEWDKETVNGIFRAVHSIKGAAGAFAYSNIVDFAHHYETVLDRVRSDKLLIEGDILKLSIRSADILAELVDCARDNSEPPAAAAKITTELEALVNDGAPEAYNLINGLHQRGLIKVNCMIKDVPDLDNFDFDEGYLSWRIRVEGANNEELIALVN